MENIVVHICSWGIFISNIISKFLRCILRWSKAVCCIWRDSTSKGYFVAATELHEFLIRWVISYNKVTTRVSYLFGSIEGFELQIWDDIYKTSAVCDVLHECASVVMFFVWASLYTQCYLEFSAKHWKTTTRVFGLQGCHRFHIPWRGKEAWQRCQESLHCGLCSCFRTRQGERNTNNDVWNVSSGFLSPLLGCR